MSEQLCVTPWGLIYHLLIGYGREHICSSYLESAVAVDPVDVWTYLKFFGTTLFLEYPIYYLFLRQPSSWKITNKNILAILVINLATHPIVFFMFPYLSGKFEWSFAIYLLIAEVFAPVVEAIILATGFKVSWKKAIATAVLANIFSWMVGVLLLH